MSITLKKGGSIDLRKKDNPRITIGAGWDAGDNFDLDLSAIPLNSEGKVPGGKKDIVCWNNSSLKGGNGMITGYKGGIVHTGDNITGEGEGDDEQVILDWDKIPADVTEIVFFVDIYSGKARGQHFGKIKNAFIRAFNPDTNQEICRFNLSSDKTYNGQTAMFLGKAVRTSDSWQFVADGTPTTDDLEKVKKKYSGGGGLFGLF